MTDPTGLRLKAVQRLIPQQTQRQDSLMDQLEDVRIAANLLGRYDAADWLKRAAKLVTPREATPDPVPDDTPGERGS